MYGPSPPEAHRLGCVHASICLPTLSEAGHGWESSPPRTVPQTAAEGAGGVPSSAPPAAQAALFHGGHGIRFEDGVMGWDFPPRE